MQQTMILIQLGDNLMYLMLYKRAAVIFGKFGINSQGVRRIYRVEQILCRVESANPLELSRGGILSAGRVQTDTAKSLPSDSVNAFYISKLLRCGLRNNPSLVFLHRMSSCSLVDFRNLQSLFPLFSQSASPGFFLPHFSFSLFFFTDLVSQRERERHRKAGNVKQVWLADLAWYLVSGDICLYINRTSNPAYRAYHQDNKPFCVNAGKKIRKLLRLSAI